jgi:catechol 2,3-dioxygenase-like lactoylglutathione lyase family enzyme
MGKTFQSSRDIIIRTTRFAEAAKFYESVLGFPGTRLKETMIGFETGGFCLYVEKGKKHGPVFEFLVPNVKIARRKLLAAGCTIVEEDPSVPRCYVRDPFGMVFNIGQA